MPIHLSDTLRGKKYEAFSAFMPGKKLTVLRKIRSKFLLVSGQSLPFRRVFPSRTWHLISIALQEAGWQ